MSLPDAFYLRHLSNEKSVFVPKTDLREDKHYLADHPGLVPVTTAQVRFSRLLLMIAL